MTTSSIMAAPIRRRGERGYRSAARGGLLALPLVAVLLVGSAPPSPLAPTTPRRAAATLETDRVREPRAAAAIQPANLQKIADFLAKRYRVSSRATMDVVRTAYQEANRNGLDPLLVLAVMAIESSFNPIAESEMGAVGLMQIVPRFHQDKLASGRESALEPRINIAVGTQVLREYIRRAGTETAGLQLYNGSSDDPANAYATKVMSERDRLRQAIRRAETGRA